MNRTIAIGLVGALGVTLGLAAEASPSAEARGDASVSAVRAEKQWGYWGRRRRNNDANQGNGGSTGSDAGNSGNSGAGNAAQPAQPAQPVHFAPAGAHFTVEMPTQPEDDTLGQPQDPELMRWKIDNSTQSGPVITWFLFDQDTRMLRMANPGGRPVTARNANAFFTREIHDYLESNQGTLRGAVSTITVGGAPGREYTYEKASDHTVHFVRELLVDGRVVSISAEVHAEHEQQLRPEVDRVFATLAPAHPAAAAPAHH